MQNPIDELFGGPPNENPVVHHLPQDSECGFPYKWVFETRSLRSKQIMFWCNYYDECDDCRGWKVQQIMDRLGYIRFDHPDAIVLTTTKSWAKAISSSLHHKGKYWKISRDNLNCTMVYIPESDCKCFNETASEGWPTEAEIDKLVSKLEKDRKHKDSGSLGKRKKDPTDRTGMVKISYPSITQPMNIDDRVVRKFIHKLAEGGISHEGLASEVEERYAVIFSKIIMKIRGVKGQVDLLKGTRWICLDKKTTKAKENENAWQLMLNLEGALR